MPVWTNPVHPALRAMVMSWVGYDFRTEPHSVHRGLPSTAVTVVLSMEEPVECGWLASTTSNRYDSVVAGLHIWPALIRTHGHQHGLHLALSPAGARVLTGVPAGKVAGHMVDAAELGWPEHLLDRMRHATWPHRFQLLQDYLLQRVNTAASHARPEVDRAWQLLCSAHGALRVEQIAALVGLSRRRLSTLLREEVGLTPKQASRLARFENAQKMMATGQPLAGVADLAGYSDQAHFTREWKEFVGLTPAESRRDFPIIQDGRPRFP